MKIHVKVAIYSCLLNGFLSAVKYSLCEASASLALKADGHNSDTGRIFSAIVQAVIRLLKPARSLTLQTEHGHQEARGSPLQFWAARGMSDARNLILMAIWIVH